MADLIACTDRVTWPYAAIWIAVIVASAGVVIALAVKGYGVNLKFQDPDEPTYKWERKS